MTRLVACISMAAFLLTCFSDAVSAGERNRSRSGATQASEETDVQMDEMARQYLRQKRMRRGGGVLLGSGIGIIVAGAALVEIDAWGKIGMAGFTCLGTGIGLSVTGMFLLAFAKKLPRDARHQSLSAVPVHKGQGLSLVYSRSF